MYIKSEIKIPLKEIILCIFNINEILTFKKIIHFIMSRLFTGVIKLFCGTQNQSMQSVMELVHANMLLRRLAPN